VCVHNRILAWKNDLGGCFGIVNTEIHEAWKMVEIQQKFYVWFFDLEIQKQHKTYETLKRMYPKNSFESLHRRKKINSKKSINTCKPQNETKPRERTWDEGKFFLQCSTKTFSEFDRKSLSCSEHTHNILTFSSFLCFSSLLFVVLAIGAEVSDLMILMVGKEKGIFRNIYRIQILSIIW
jgi:hypothetical protein